LSAASIPFCKGITAVSGPISGLICSPALSRSHNFTQNSTTSTLPTALGSSVACVGTRWVSPRPPSILRPALFMAARCAPRAMKVTSAPAFASAAPKPPPTPPAPTTAIFIPFSHQSKLDADFALMLRKRNAFVLASCRRALQNDQTMDISELDRLTRWLMEGARSAPTPTTFLKEMCERLVAAGLPLYRVGAFVQTLHPARGGCYRLYRATASVYRWLDPRLELEHAGRGRLHRRAFGRVAIGHSAVQPARRDPRDAPHGRRAARYLCRQPRWRAHPRGTNPPGTCRGHAGRDLAVGFARLYRAVRSPRPGDRGRYPQSVFRLPGPGHSRAWR